MKKRIVCVLLTLIMMLSLVPMGASAATHTTSESAITVLKRMMSFNEKCYHYNGEEFRTGYGTVCDKEHYFTFDSAANKNIPDNTKLNADGTPKNVHTINQSYADTALRNALKKLDTKVCAFESANKLSLSQSQHDALVLLSYLGGADWMNGNGVLKSAILGKCNTTEMLNAVNTWTKNISLARSQVLVNMYQNGIYSNDIPSSYGVVTYNAGIGGSMPQHDYNDSTKYTFYYDLNSSVAHPVTPTRSGATFLGWYANVNGTDTSNAVWASSLNHIYNNHTLTALWQTDEYTPTTVKYSLKVEQLVEGVAYNLDGTANAEETKKLQEDLRVDGYVAVDKDLIDRSGNRWSHPAGYGNVRIKVGTPSGNSFTDNGGTVIATATVTVNGYLNLRQEPGTDSKIVGALAKNETVNLYEIKTVNGHQWGRSKSGWLCLTHTRVIMKNDANISDEGALTYAFTAKIVNGSVKAHVEAGDNTNLAYYYNPDNNKVELEIPKNTAVTLTNLAVSNGETWAKATWTNKEWQYTNAEKTKKGDVNVTRSGWVKLTYNNEASAHVQLDTVKYTTIADAVNVRSYWGDASSQAFTLNKGVEIDVVEIALVGENIWGRIIVKKASQTGAATDEIGFVNLAAKYFKRNTIPTLSTTNPNANKIATVINTDTLKVRNYGATYGKRIGSLSRGTTVAVWEANDDDWYKVDSNKNGVYDEKEDGWCFGAYLDIREGTVNGNTTVTDTNGNKYETDGTGKGIVANTYTGVNVRTGPGTGYATNGKLLTGTVVDILETANARKWGRTAQGWICMDYVTMLTYNEAAKPTTNKGTTVESFDKADKTTTTAVYTGVLMPGAAIYRNPVENADELIRTTSGTENVTMYELAKVSTVIKSDDTTTGDTTVSTTTTVTGYWARVNEGWVKDPEKFMTLNALDEKVHTQTGVEKLNVRREANENVDNVFDVLVQGDQVKVTALKIIGDKVWGRIETANGTGWIRLDYMSEGEVYVKKPETQNTTVNNVLNNLGQTSTTGGYVTNNSGYRYTGKVIRANEVNVRANPSTTAAKTTSLKNGAALVIYETTIAENMAWGRCDAGWVYLYYVDLTPSVAGAVDARVVFNDNTIIYSDVNGSAVAGTYAKMSTVDIYEIVGKMARTDKGWINTDNLL